MILYIYLYTYILFLQGSKRFLEDHLDASDSPLLSETHYTMCLDSLGAGDTIRMHVSKKPKDNSPAHIFFQVSRNRLQRYI